MQEETIQHQDVSQVVGAEEGVIEEIAEPQEGQETESDKELNFARLRDSKEEIERKARLLEQENQQLRQWYAQQMQPKSAASSSEEDDTLDLSEAVDSEALKKVVGYFEKRDKKKEQYLQKEIAKQKAELSSLALKSKDPEYLQTINKYLPGVLEENPSIKNIIANIPEHEQISVMYQFATANKQYIMDNMQKDSGKSSKPSSIEKNMMQKKTLGSATGHSAIKNKGVWDMTKEEFYKHLEDLARVYP